MHFYELNVIIPLDYKIYNQRNRRLCGSFKKVMTINGATSLLFITQAIEKRMLKTHQNITNYISTD